MGTLNYVANLTLDGYVADADGGFDWIPPNAAVFAAHVERLAEVSTEVLGRKTYLLMRHWETDHDDFTPDEQEFARRWREVEKVVVSSTLTPADLGTSRARIVPRLDLAELRKIVDDAPGAVSIFGPTTAAEAIRAGLVDALELFVLPKVVGGGLRALPDDAELDLHLVDPRTFEDGTLYLRYRRR